MAGVAEVSLVLDIISSIISIIDAIKQVYETVKDEVGLSKNFKKSATKLPLISKLLEDAQKYVETGVDEINKIAFRPTLEHCQLEATHLQKLFTKVMPNEDDSRLDRYVKAARTIGKNGRVKKLLRQILDDLQLMTINFLEVTTPRSKEQLAKIIETEIYINYNIQHSGDLLLVILFHRPRLIASHLNRETRDIIKPFFIRLFSSRPRFRRTRNDTESGT